MSKRVSLADIARRVGLGKSTVSMALRDAGTVSSVTCKRVQQIAHSMGYHPNPLLASLGSKQFGSRKNGFIPIAFLQHASPDPYSESADPEGIRNVQERGHQLGYRVERFDLTEFKNGAHATRLLSARGFQGIILPNRFPLEFLSGMDWSRFSVVGWGFETGATSLNLPRAVVDHFSGVLQTWEQVRSRGYQRIGFALFEAFPKLRDDQLRLGAMQFCLHTIPRRLRIPPYFGTIREKDLPKLACWAKRYRPDAIVGFNSSLLWGLVVQGFSCPRDFGFACLHRDAGDDYAIDRSQSESGMREMRVSSMLAALELLDQEIRHRQCGLSPQPRTVMINPEWIEGVTLPVQ